MNIDELLKVGIEREASDIHLKVGQHPTLRIHGALFPLTGLGRLTAQEMDEVIEDLLNEYQRKKLRENLDVDFAYSLSGYGRFRGNIYFQRGTLALSLRIIPFEVKAIRELLLPEILETICEYPRGLVLVTGTTGSGKTTTLASMIDHINRLRRERIITIEEPIEFLHADKQSMICQREVGEDVMSFARGLKAALREDPDVILVGEMRDSDTIDTAIMAAETGHLVLSTLHTLDAPESINRIVAAFPPHQHRQIRLQLANLLRAVISMRLIPRQDGAGRVPAVEVMITTSYIQECILDREKTNFIRDAIQTGVSEYGMQTFDQSIYQLFHHGYISFEQGLTYCSNPDGFKLRVQGIQSTLDIALEDMEKRLKQIDRRSDRGRKGKE
ncbi:MAG: PilT/PilU family type 4a pilus ATPase [Candidatus Aminicenantes bacterium]|nr:PilT/PilU family type 4a pilus ATPase [Candidatus Aminicenantes bacterium]